MIKMKSMKIAVGDGVNYIVMVRNSAQYNPGDTISDSEVETLCRKNSGWEIVRVPLNKKEI